MGKSYSHKSHSIRSHPASIVNSIIGKPISLQNGKDNVAEKIRAVNRANNLKDNVKRHISGSGLHSHKTKKYKHKKHLNSSVHSAPIGNGIGGGLLSVESMKNKNEIQMAGINGGSSSKPSAIHPALSEAVQTVNRMN